MSCDRSAEIEAILIRSARRKLRWRGGRPGLAARERFAEHRGLHPLIGDDLVRFWAYTNGTDSVAVFTGTRGKPDFWERHAGGMEAVQRRCAKALQAQQKRAAERASMREAPRGVDVGDVLVSSWGYEQTNIDFYEVTALRGAQSAELRAIKAESRDLGGMQGECTPRPGEFKGAPFVVRIREGACRIGSHKYAKRLEPVVVVGGARVWPVQHWTAYA